MYEYIFLGIYITRSKLVFYLDRRNDYVSNRTGKVSTSFFDDDNLIQKISSFKLK